MSASAREHGGDLQHAARCWHIPVSQWLDLSTAISPFSYPLPNPPVDIWQRLPYPDSALVEIARQYYQCEHLLPVAGSQQAIEILPQLFPRKTVALPALGYSEHAWQWQACRHRVVYYEQITDLETLAASNAIDIAVVINPNNPTAEYVPPDTLLKIASMLEKRQGCLIVDEAFMDTRPQQSLVSALPDNAIVLRSVGKFFGLAGIRMGFVIARPDLLTRLENKTGLWQISGPAFWAAKKALADHQWQTLQTQRVMSASRELEKALNQHGKDLLIRREDLFVSMQCSRQKARSVFENCARKGILLRRFDLPDNKALLRAGLPPDGDSFQRLMAVFSR